MSGKYDLISQSISEIDDGKTEQSDTSSIPRRDCRAANEQENSGNHNDLIQIQQFFPFDVDIVGEVVEIETNPTEHGKMNITKRTEHTIANLQRPEYLTNLPLKPNSRKPTNSKLHSSIPDDPSPDKTYWWFHLPANDMHWFENIVKSVYVASRSGKTKPEILDPRRWTDRRRGQLNHTSPNRFRPHMEPYCGLLNRGVLKEEPQLAIYMPYLHWNIPYNQQYFREAFERLAEQYKNRDKGSAELFKLYTEDRCRSVYPFDDDLPYHPTRTLDQYFCQNLNTDMRDATQTCVGEDEKLLVIDQLWIMVPSNDTIVTAFPSRPVAINDDSDDACSLGRSDSTECSNIGLTGFMNLSDHLHTEYCSCGFADLRNAVHRDFKLSKKLGLARETPRILAALIMHHAVCELLGSKCRNQAWGMNVEATFQNRIAETKFEARRRLATIMEDPYSELLLNDALNLDKELELWRDASAVEEDAGILKRLLGDQRIIINEFKRKATDLAESERKTIDSILTETIRRLDNFDRSVCQIHTDAESLTKFIQGILDRKQQFAAMIEAKKSKEVAEVSAKMAEVSAKMAEVSAKQGQATMVFTTVTVIFLPMSFLASILGMNIKEWTGGVSITTFQIFAGISVFVSILALTVALRVNALNDARRVLKAYFRDFFRKLRDRKPDVECGNSKQRMD